MVSSIYVIFFAVCLCHPILSAPATSTSKITDLPDQTSKSSQSLETPDFSSSKHRPNSKDGEEDLLYPNVQDETNSSSQSAEDQEAPVLNSLESVESDTNSTEDLSALWSSSSSLEGDDDEAESNLFVPESASGESESAEDISGSHTRKERSLAQPEEGAEKPYGVFQEQESNPPTSTVTSLETSSEPEVETTTEDDTIVIDACGGDLETVCRGKSSASNGICIRYLAKCPQEATTVTSEPDNSILDSLVCGGGMFC